MSGIAPTENSRKESSLMWQVVYVDPKGNEGSATFAEKTKAEDIADLLENCGYTIKHIHAF